MPTSFSHILLLLLLLVFTVLSDALTRTHHRRILHQPFFPLDSSPPSLSPPPPPPLPFFPSTPSLPTSPPPPLTPSPFASYPANITSLNIPHSPSSTHTVSKKLLAITIVISLSAALLAGIAFFLYFRGRPSKAAHASITDKSSRSAISSTPHNDDAPPPTPPPRNVPKLRNPGPSSAEFLYLGTLANSASSISGSGRLSQSRARGSSRPRRLDSPELHPLPPLIGRQDQQLRKHYDEDGDEFYSPRGSVSGRDTGSDSIRVSAIVTDNNDGNSNDTMTTSSSSSGSDSPARSASVSISPPISASPKKNRLSSSNSDPKSSPEFIELQFQPIQAMMSSPPYSPSSTTSYESEKQSEIVKDEDEAEESPLLSIASSSSRMTSPLESPTLSPLTGRIGEITSDEREGNVVGRNSPSQSPSNVSSSSRKSSFSSLKLPAFLSGGKRKTSPESCSERFGSAAPLPPPPPPPPPAVFRKPQSPPPPPQPPISQHGDLVAPLKPVLVDRLERVSSAECSGSVDSEETTPKPKLKPLHWDKVKASSDKEMVWDQFRSSSFKLNEEMIETLFVVKNPNPNKKETPRSLVSPLAKQENRVLDPKKAQNIAILLRALNVTMEEVCEALMEGNAETLGTELLESLLKMAPTKEEERKLMEYKDDSPVKLGHAEKFLKAVIEIPFAFKRVETMLYIANFESEVEYLKKSFDTLELACDELRSSRMFLKLLDAVLKTGNRMNVGTNRGDAHAFKLDTLLKLVDVKGADGKTTLLHFVVQEIIRTEGQRLSTVNNQPSNDEVKCRKLGLQVVSSLGSELANVKKAASMDSDVLSNDVSKLSSGLANIGQVVKLIEQIHLQESSRGFSESMNKFIKTAEEDIFRVQAQERVALSLVKEITEYFHGNSAMEEAHPFRIFMVVRDLLTVLDRVCKEVGMINERTAVSSAHRFPVPVNPMLPVPVNPFHPQVLPGFPGQKQSSFSDNGSP